ncbi:MAG: S8 family serine peptidase [Myxococcota bacterium]
MNWRTATMFIILAGCGGTELPPEEEWAALAQVGADRDLDGVPDAIDNCPDIANEPDQGVQPPACGPALDAVLHDYVFLDARMFRPTVGIDSALQLNGQPRHVMLHIVPDPLSPSILSDAQETQLDSHGILLHDYVPHYTFYASVPGNLAALTSLVNLSWIRGVTALTADDRIERDLRATGTTYDGPNAAGAHRFEVEFFKDVPLTARATALSNVNATIVAQDDEVYVVELQFPDMLTLANYDGVVWISDGSLNLIADTDGVGMDIGNAARPQLDLNLRGTGLTFGMGENYHPHTDLDAFFDGRVQHAGAGKEAPDQSKGHANSVAGILVGDHTTDPELEGVLPAASLVSYSTRVFPWTHKHRGYHQPRSAQSNHGAVAYNMSAGYKDCKKLGKYKALSKWTDKSVYKRNIIFVHGAGNSRSHEDCPTANVSSISPTGKNVLTVGDWHVASESEAPSSGIGPTDDGRLKPDLMAPGSGMQAPVYDWADSGSNKNLYAAFGGSSAAAPFATGVVGQVLETLANATPAIAPSSVDPSTAKAILLHTARDVGPSGPDHITGYGLIDAAAAVRIAQDHDDYVKLGTIIRAGTHHDETFTIDPTDRVYSYKVTLVWDDKQGSPWGAVALKDDLDLQVTDPLGNVHYAWNVVPPASPTLADLQAGGQPCNAAGCVDHRNPVEQVVISNGGAPLSQGLWTIRVNGHRLVSRDVPFTLVLSPECPIRITTDTTLTGDVTCPYESLSRKAVIIERNGVTLDCNGHSIQGPTAVGTVEDPTVGIWTNRDDVTITNCTVTNFDVGLWWEDGARGRSLTNTVAHSTFRGVRLEGFEHRVEDTTINGVTDNEGIGMELQGKSHILYDNVITLASGPGERSGVWVWQNQVDAGAHRITWNNISNTDVGIELQGISEDEGEPDVPDLVDTRVEWNDIEGVFGHGITLFETDEVVINLNEIVGYGASDIGIFGSEEKSDIISGNEIRGSTGSSQKGIRLSNGTSTLVRANRIWDSGIAIEEEGGNSNRIFLNRSTSPNLQGIRVQNCNSIGAQHIDQNEVFADGAVGIFMSDCSDGRISDNLVEDAVTGIFINTVMEDPSAVTVNSNIVRRPQALGIRADRLDQANIFGNTITHTDGNATGIQVLNTTGLDLVDNGVQSLNTCLSVNATTDASIDSNRLNDCNTVGIVVAGGDVELDDNEFQAMADIGIDLVGTQALVLQQRFVSATGSVGIRAEGTTGVSPVTGDLEIVDQLLTTGYQTGLLLRPGWDRLVLRDNDIYGSSHGLLTESGATVGLTTLDIHNNAFTSGIGGIDAEFANATYASAGRYSDAATLDLIDGDGDGLADCGLDYPYQSATFSGGGAHPLRFSFTTIELKDWSPATSVSGTCP